MKANLNEAKRRLWLGAAIGLALMIVVTTPQTTEAQWSSNGNNIYYNSGNVGIGTNAPDKKLVVSANSATTLPASGGMIQLFGADGAQSIILNDGFAAQATFLARRANTSAASPSALQANDMIGLFGASGYGSTGYQGTRARVAFFASENWTNSANGTYVTFNTTANGAATAGGSERMRIDNAGNVGIGTPSPSYLLDVAGTIRSSTGGFQFPNGTVQTEAAAVTAGAGLTGGGGGSSTLNIGAGAGVTVGADSISVNYGSSSTSAVRGDTQITITTGTGSGLSGGGASQSLGSGPNFTLVNSDKGSDQNIFKTVATDSGSPTQFSATSNTDTLRFAGSGGTTVTLDANNKKVTIDATGSTASAANVAAGTFGANIGNGDYTFPANVTVNGVIHSRYQDMAEYVSSVQAVSAGTVMVLDPTKSNHVTSSARPYDTSVAGVVSEQPGIALGEGGVGKVLVATTGRVLVNVDASRSAIHIGDLLVTSDVRGVAMKSEPVNVGGIQLHRPGTLIGKALEPLEKGKGKILVLLSLQ